MKNLTEPVAMPNITKWKVPRVRDYQDDEEPYLEVFLQVLGAGGVTYGMFKLKIWANQPCDQISVNPDSLSYGDKIMRKGALLPGAYESLAAANKAPGTRASQLQQVEDLLLTTGVVDPSLG